LSLLAGSPSPAELAEELGLLQIQDTDAMASWVDQAFAANQKAVRDALGNPKKARAAAGFLRGQVMNISGGKADPKLVGEMIQQRLAQSGELSS
jgi:aspartyl-tRNA(Asn)/glutamyl-tRNA(Gln) amidotransferase subunit B